MLDTRELLFLLTPRLGEHGHSIGRDYLFDLLEANGLLIRYRRQRMLTSRPIGPSTADPISLST